MPLQQDYTPLSVNMHDATNVQTVGKIRSGDNHGAPPVQIYLRRSQRGEQATLEISRGNLSLAHLSGYDRPAPNDSPKSSARNLQNILT
jgi:hypothetical protein